MTKKVCPYEYTRFDHDGSAQPLEAKTADISDHPWGSHRHNFHCCHDFHRDRHE